MQGVEQLSSFPAAEGVGRPSMEGVIPRSEKQEGFAPDLRLLPVRHKDDKKASPPSSPQPSKVEKRARKATPSPGSPYLQPLPTIETLMTYPSISRPVYDRLVRGEVPAQTYKTIIHTPKPPNMRVLDQNLLRAAELSAFRRRKRANSGPRSRSNTASSTASSVSAYSSNASSVGADSDSSTSDVSDPPSPASVSSASKATISSSPVGSPRYALFPSLTPEPVFAPVALSPTQSIESDSTAAYSRTPSREATPSPTLSFHSTLSVLSSLSVPSSEHGTPSSARSSAPSPASSAYPSPPTSPQISRRSSSSEEEYMALSYPSPPPSPNPAQQPQVQHRERRAFTFPGPAAPAPPPLRRRGASLSSHPWTDPVSDAQEFDLGEQRLGGGDLYVEEEGDMEWSMNGGEVVFGAAGVALSPRAMRGSCCSCEHKHGAGLGLYVIDEEEEERSA